MKHPVIAIGLDAADPEFLEPWMEQGHLKTLARIRQSGAYAHIHGYVNYKTTPQVEFSSTEPLWVQFSTGCLPEKTGFWDTITYDPKTYSVGCDAYHGGYDYQEYKPFYSLGDKYRVAAFDVPVSGLADQVNGLQVLGWGGHFPFVPSVSEPANLLPSIVEKYGTNPVLRRDSGNWWSDKYKAWVQQAIADSLTTRTQILRELLEQERWDLFVTGLGETHTAGHDLYDRSQPDHLLHGRLTQNGTQPDLMLQAYQRVDQALGEVLKSAPQDAYVMIFSVHGMGANLTDQMSMFFLAELLYRYNFPGQVALAPGKVGTTPIPPIAKPIRGSWAGEIWRKIHEPNPIKRVLNNWLPKQFLEEGKFGLLSPYPLLRDRVELGWMPAFWYKPLWPKMKAFAMPAFADGHIRINLKGREQDGIVEPEEYDQVCQELEEMLLRLTDGRTGKPLVREVVRTRINPLDMDPKLPDPDLVVCWHEIPTDVVDSPDYGRIGPIALNRPGGHRARGFMMIQGPGIEAGTVVADGAPVDLPATILNLMGAPIPDYFDGKPLLEPAKAAPTVQV
ncbi:MULTISPECIES: alkaline phosphatase family protein [unclassified Leptolyngbya]|uniref:alkaline phosphatase family protein n=1 Tax=unclassified Leptolyngbya TaxID=2650499 RepID=UPI001683F6F8|nr:alkaline phosphatase family protein [Leptolyngbya sp. FACHB-8]MBD2158159.1 alkaline phosphatase family protein [Leptolyngbya sp. FACHB-16]